MQSEQEIFQDRGFALLRAFYDAADDIAAIQSGIADIIGRVATRHRQSVPMSTPIEAMTSGYLQLIRTDRSWGGEVYDAVKQIPAFLRLVADPRNEAIFRRFRPGSTPGIAAGGFGIRIDNPGEGRFRAPWHQEFPAQLRSLDGIVFWTPLLAVTPEMGPVDIAEGSHREGMIPVYEEAPASGRSGAYALRLQDEERLLAKYRTQSPLTQPGDLLLMDFLTMHQSGENTSNQPRWTLQFRYFNFGDPLGTRIGWRGSFAEKVDFRSVLPELAARGAVP